MDREYCPECGCEMEYDFECGCWYCEECDTNYTQCLECEQWYPTDNESCDFCGCPQNEIEDDEQSSSFFYYKKREELSLLFNKPYYARVVLFSVFSPPISIRIEFTQTLNLVASGLVKPSTRDSSDEMEVKVLTINVTNPESNYCCELRYIGVMSNAAPPFEFTKNVAGAALEQLFNGGGEFL